MNSRTRKGLNQFWAAVGALVAVAALVYACSARPASAGVTPQARTGCAAPHHATGKHTLAYIAWHQTHGDVAYLLTATLRCNGGTRFPAFLQFYLNEHDMTLPVPKGTRLWFNAPGIGQPLAVHQ